MTGTEIETDLDAILDEEITESAEIIDKKSYLTEPADQFAAKYLMTVEPTFAEHLFRPGGCLSDWCACQNAYEQLRREEEAERNRPQTIRIDLAANREVKHKRPGRTSDQMAEALLQGPATVRELCDRMKRAYNHSVHSTMSVIVHKDPRFVGQYINSDKGNWKSLLISLADN